ncbi:MAG: glycosyltransferase family 1 protein [Verrucomicrobia bacterium]|nr:MAG: glycosyltransferase family 1 protein [Verrucomicrobiota bacterium]
MWQPERLPYNGRVVKICDLTQFYSPVSGGVKRYLHEKIDYIERHTSRDEHVLIVPGPKSKLEAKGRSRVYAIRSPLVSRTAQYRALLNLRTVQEILEQERPDVIESGDPYQLGWKALKVGHALRVPVVGFYHSHFPEAYVRKSATLLGKTATRRVMKLSRAYVRKLYNQHAATLVASERLGRVLRDWGVQNVRVLSLGVNTEIFHPDGSGTQAIRRSLGVNSGQKLLLYVGRLAKEKNTATLLRAFRSLQRRQPNQFHLLVIGDGPDRIHLRNMQLRTRNLSWIRYCADPCELAGFYRAADLFVHPGVQETFGLVALESQACGTPVVGIHGSYMDRIICHDQQWWAQENSADALADAIEATSAQKLSTLGECAARAAGKLYSWPCVFEKLFCIYREVCSNYRGFKW